MIKFLTLGVAAAAAIWGAYREHRQKMRGQPRKRLSRSGYIAIAFVIGGLMLSLASLGFETLAQQQAEENEKQEASRKALYDFRMEQRAKRTLDLQILARAEARERAAEDRANRAEQRILALQVAGEQRERDLELARTVNRRSRENLERTQVALSQVERALYPIGNISLSITWHFPAEMPGLAGQTARLTELARQVRSAPEQFRPLAGLSWHASNDGTIDFITVERGNPYFPLPSGTAADGNLGTLLRLAEPNLEIFARSAGLSGFNAIHGRVPDMNIQLREARHVTYFPGSGGISFETWFEGQLDRGPTGRIISIPDLESSYFSLKLWGPFSGDRIQLLGGWLEMGSRSYSLYLTEDPETVPGRRTWHLDRLPPPE